MLFCVLALLLTGLVAAGGAQAQPELAGIDVSNWQHQIDWLAVSGTGTRFVFAKATEGTTYTDTTFALNRPGAKGIGLRFGAYHFARPAGSTDAAAVASATAQADYFLSLAQPVPGELLPALDLESTGGLSSPRLGLWVQAWLDQVVARTGWKPVVYVSPSFWKTRLGDSPVVAAAGHRLWIAHWTMETLPILPGASWGGLGWSFWQWSNCQRIAGIAGCVDGDRFNGSTLASVVVPTYPGGPPAPAGAPDDRRAAANGQAARGPPRRLGWREAGLVWLPVATLRRLRERLYPDYRGHLGDIHPHRGRRRSSPRRPRRRVRRGRNRIVLVGADACGRERGNSRRDSADRPVAADDRGPRPGRRHADRQAGDVDRVADLVLLPVASLRRHRYGLQRDRGGGSRHLHGLTRRHRLNPLAHGHRGRQGRRRLIHLDRHRCRHARAGPGGRRWHDARPGGTGRCGHDDEQGGGRHVAARRPPEPGRRRPRRHAQPSRPSRHGNQAQLRCPGAAAVADRRRIRDRTPRCRPGHPAA